MSISDATLMAYVDGELPPQEAQAVELAAAGDASLRARLQQQRMLAGAVRDTFAAVAQAPSPERLNRLAAAPPAERAPVRWWWAAGAALAASLVAAVLGAQVFASRGVIDEHMIARGDLDRALDVQLASDQGSAYRIGLTFRSRDGEVCRSFQPRAEDGLAGLACRRSGDWKVLVAMPAEPVAAGDFRTAAVQVPPTVAALAQELAAGPALDSADEAAAREGGWR